MVIQVHQVRIVDLAASLTSAFVPGQNLRPQTLTCVALRTETMSVWPDFAVRLLGMNLAPSSKRGRAN